MNFLDLLIKKRDGKIWSENDIKFLVGSIVDDKTPDYQIGALLMTIYFQGLNDMETVQLTKAMVSSGEVLDFGTMSHQLVDKHSTGGVGDKTSLIVMPLLASVGIRSSKLSGAGLGHTGGTIDKLSSFPGFRSDLSTAQIQSAVKSVDFAIGQQTNVLVPADKRLYALRDVTGTIDNISLIASSIMSKKIASGAGAIVLDIKVGHGAMLQELERARKLANLMISIGRELGRKVTALITDMDSPLGNSIGNISEVKEAIEVLNGRGETRLNELCIQLAMHAGMMAGRWKQADDARHDLLESLETGKALKKFQGFVRNQGGDDSYVENPDQFDKPRFQKILNAPSEGYIQAINARTLGLSAMKAGGGRAEKDDIIDLTAGITLNVSQGSYVKEGQSLLTIYGNDLKKVEEGFALTIDAIEIGTEAAVERPIVMEVIQPEYDD